MLLWEQMRQLTRGKIKPEEKTVIDARQVPIVAPKPPRSKFDKRCAAKTKQGRQCRGHIVEGSDYCSFHDPNLTKDQRSKNASKGGRSNRNLAHVLDGYLRPLTDEAAVGQALDRLYREVRLGTVTPDMGRVLLDILTRLLHEGLAKPEEDPNRDFKRTKAYRFKKKLDSMLTRAEKVAWRRAVNDAPTDFFHPGTKEAKVKRPAKKPAAPKTESKDKTLPVAM